MDGKQQVEPTAWGRSRFGGSGAGLIALSLGLGLVLAGLIAALIATLAFAEKFWMAWPVFGFGLLPVLCAGVWAVLVDRNTLRGAVRDPESSIESRWYDRAACGVFQDLLIVCGLGAAVFSVLGLNAPIGAVLGAVLLAAMLDFAVCYLLTRRAEG